MSRLTNLTTLRIGIFGNWHSSWYDQEYYNFLVFKDYKLIEYLNSIFYRLRLPTSHFFINRINQKYYYIESNIYINKSMFRRLTKSISSHKQIFKYISLVEYLFDIVFLLPQEFISEKNMIDYNQFSKMNSLEIFLYYYLSNLNSLDSTNKDILFYDKNTKFRYILDKSGLFFNIDTKNKVSTDSINLNFLKNLNLIKYSSHIYFDYLNYIYLVDSFYKYNNLLLKSKNNNKLLLKENDIFTIAKNNKYSTINLLNKITSFKKIKNKLNIFSNFLNINNIQKNKFINLKKKIVNINTNTRTLSEYHFSFLLLYNNKINWYNYLLNINNSNILNYINKFIYKFLHNYIFIFLKIYIVLYTSLNNSNVLLNNILYKLNKSIVLNINYLKKIKLVKDYKLSIKTSIKLNYIKEVLHSGYKSILKSKELKGRIFNKKYSHETGYNNYINDKYNKYTSLLLENNINSNLLGLYYLKDFNNQSKKTNTNSITIENDKFDVVYYKQVNKLNKFYKRINTLINTKFISKFNLLIENTIFNYTGLQCFFLPTYYIKDFPSFDTKLLVDYISYNLKRRQSIIKLFNKITLLQKKENRNTSKLFINLFNELSNLNNKTLKYNKYLSFFNFNEFFSAAKMSKIYNEQIKRKKNPISGIRIEFSGPPKKAERSKTVAYYDFIQDYRLVGKMPTHSIYADISYYQSYIRLKRSTLGIKVWLFYYTRILDNHNVNKTIL